MTDTPHPNNPGQPGSTFADGIAPVARPARVAFTDAGVTIITDAGTVVWSYAGMARVAHHSGKAVFSHTDHEGARLTLAEVAIAHLTRHAPHVLRDTKARRGATVVVAVLVGAALITGFLAFVVWPRAAIHIARATPPEVELALAPGSETFIETISNPCTDNAAANDALAALSDRLEQASGSVVPFTVQIVDAGFPNAFAMAGGRIIVTDELLDIMETPDELAGVLAHEAAHVAERHVMAQMLRAFGAGVLIDLTVGGGSGAGQGVAIFAANVDALRHTRAAERQADAKALEYLSAAGLDPMGLALFFERLEAWFAEQEMDDIEALTAYVPELLSSHPNTRTRAQDARETALGLAQGVTYAPALNAEEWSAIKAACEGMDDPIGWRRMIPERLRPDPTEPEGSDTPIDDALAPSEVPAEGQP